MQSIRKNSNLSADNCKALNEQKQKKSNLFNCVLIVVDDTRPRFDTKIGYVAQSARVYDPVEGKMCFKCSNPKHLAKEYNRQSFCNPCHNANFLACLVTYSKITNFYVSASGLGQRK